MNWPFPRSLFGKYVVAFVGLIVLVLLANGALETWFTYDETTQLLAKAQSEKAEATGRRIDQFIEELERQISWATRASTTTVEQRQADYALLLQQAPAIERLIHLDNAGKEQLRVTRRETVVGSGIDYSANPRFIETKSRSVWLSPVYFDGRDPFIAIAMKHSGPNAGSTVAEVSLRPLSNLIGRDQIGQDYEAYVVGPDGRLLAHSDLERLPGSNFAELPQVAAAIKDAKDTLTFGKDPDGQAVLTAWSEVPRLKWFVFFEQPRSKALQPVYSLLFRTAWLLAGGVLLAAFAGTLLAYRMIIPIRALQVGAQQLEASEFGHRITVQTGDEIADLADHFNRMADQLQNSYRGLEQKVAERTRELAQSVRELSALEEIGRALASSLEINSVLATIVSRAVQLTQADAGAIYRYDSGRRTFELAESHALDLAVQERVRAVRIHVDESAMGLAARQGKSLSIPDLAGTPNYPLRDITLAAGFQSVLIVPLIAPGEILGALIVQRRSKGDFPARTVELMQTFAHQSVLAMQNAQLFREIQEKGHELAIATEHKSQFFANMSHELRTPLNGMLGFSELLLDGLYGQLPEKAADVLARMQKDGKHLLGLINDVLDISKMEAGQLTLSLSDYSVTSVVDAVTASTESLARAKGLEVKTVIPAELPIGYGDERRLTQVLLNLVGNAIKFTDKGFVEIRAESVLIYNRIAVKDTGPGIPVESQARIFDDFQQVDNSITREKGGTGLGLAISRRLVEAHGGQITLHSAPGAGATFVIVLPQRVSEQRQAA